jgi:hypothetical protein
MNVPAIVAPTLLILSLSSLPVLAADESEDVIPRTASGRPDLSGNYDISTLTPLQRRPEFGERRAFTAEEAAAIQGRAAQREVAQYLPSDPERNAPKAGGNVGGYNAFYLDRGSSPVLTKGEYRTSLIIDPPNGRFPPLTERGRQRREGLHPYGKPNPGTAWWLDTDDPRYAEFGPYDSPETMAIADRCIFHPEASIPVQPRSYNNLKTIVQTETHVVILIEWMHEARIVRLNAEHAPPGVRSLGGDSIGWWEGDTLVVDTTNFLEANWVSETLVGNPPFPSDLHVVERFSRLDKDNLLYEFTVESGDFETPFSGEYTWPQTSDHLYEYACHEGNYAMGNILRGARLLEREALESGTE